MPLTGNAAELGQGMLDAAQLAMFDLGDDHFQLIPRDTKGTPGGATEAARAAIAEGAQLILGPLYSSSIGAVRPAVQGARLSMISFSNDQSQAGSGVWTIGFSPDDQVRRVVSYAKSQGVNRIGAMVPRNAYGEVVSTALNDAAREGGRPRRPDGALRRRQHRFLARGAGAGIRRAGQPGRRDDDRRRAEAAQRRLAAAGLPDRPGAGPAARHGATWTIPRWGPNRPWSAAGTPLPIPEPAATSSSGSSRSMAAARRVSRRWPTMPPPLAAVLARNGGPAPFDPLALTNPNGFAGVDGIFRLRPDGLVERGLSVMEITPSGNRVIDPAPKSFQALGF